MAMINKNLISQISIGPPAHPKYAKSKRGWIRVIESVMGIMIIASILLIVYSQQAEKEDVADYVYDLQARILAKIAASFELRGDVLNHVREGSCDLEDVDGNPDEDKDGNVIMYHAPCNIITEVRVEIPTNFKFEVLVCDIDAVDCRLDEYPGKDVYVEERIISSTLTDYDPKKIKLFVWEI